jgi:hypothetical protein
MQSDLNQLSAQRDAVLKEMQSIDRMRRGTLSRQVFSKKDSQGQHAQGPYFVLQSFHEGEKSSRRIPADQAPLVQKQVDNFKRFEELADQCITLTDQMTQLAGEPSQCKKNSRRQRSAKSNSKKHKPS